jgi:NAD+ kinase
MRKIRAVGISAKPTAPVALQYAAKVIEDLRRRGIDVCLDFATADKLGDRGHSAVAKEDLGKQSDLLITFGGDGTLLSVARNAPAGVPVLGVNMGTLGFLTEVRVEEFPAMLELVLAGNYTAEDRVAFDVSVDGRSFRVLNDATINKSALARIIDIRVTVSGLFVTTFRADGLIVATPTGSTAYNLSAGGPIVYPTMGAIVITPICPHMLTNRPVIVPDTSVIEILNHGAEGIFLTIDGQVGEPLCSGDRIICRSSPNSIPLIRPPQLLFFDVLREKLKWGER